MCVFCLEVQVCDQTQWKVQMKMYGGPARPDAEVDNGLAKISVVQSGCFLWGKTDQIYLLSSIPRPPRDHLKEKDLSLMCKYLQKGFSEWRNGCIIVSRPRQKKEKSLCKPLTWGSVSEVSGEDGKDQVHIESSFVSLHPCSCCTLGWKCKNSSWRNYSWLHDISVICHDMLIFLDLWTVAENCVFVLLVTHSGN